jgi:DNA-binding response OmpR family regulator
MAARLAGQRHPDILIIDDDKHLTDAFRIALSRSFSVWAYNDPARAVQEFEGGKYVLVILDIHMPEMNGFDVYKELKKIDRNQKICFFTAFDGCQEEFKRVFPDEPPCQVLTKPMTIHALTEQVNQILISPPQQVKLQTH